MELPEDLVEEFLLRLPPSDPASLVRAALVCKHWCRLISTPRFRRRFREFHRTPPMLGFLANTTTKVPRFVSTSSFPPPPALAEYRGWLVLDARHGRVLLGSVDMNIGSPRLVVWGPVMNEWWKLPLLTLRTARWNAAVLCAASGSYDCDHLHCQHGGPFLVVLVATVTVAQSTLSVYSSESRAWSEPRSLASRCYVDVAVAPTPTALVGTTLYFLGSGIIGYDLATGETFVFSLPKSAACDSDTMLMTMEDVGLGVASGVAWQRWGVVPLGAPSKGFRLSLWSMETGPDGDIGWAHIRVIELGMLLPVKALSIYPKPVGFAPGVLFFNTVDGLFSANLISDQVKKELDNDEICVTKVIPYMSFCTPAQVTGLRVGASCS